VQPNFTNTKGNRKFGNSTESRQNSKVEVKVMTSGFSFKTMLSTDVSKVKHLEMFLPSCRHYQLHKSYTFMANRKCRKVFKS